MTLANLQRLKEFYMSKGKTKEAQHYENLIKRKKEILIQRGLLAPESNETNKKSK